MPLLSKDEIQSYSAALRNPVGEAAVNALMRLLSVDRLNSLYDRHSSVNGPEFAGAVLEDIGLVYTVADSSGTPVDPDEIVPDGPFITISNHPCGHLDGVCLVDLFGRIRPDYKVMVNRMLARIETLGDNFITVTPTGTERTSPTSSSISGIRMALQHLRNGGALGLFPSGAVSDLDLGNLFGIRPASGPGSGNEPSVRDREWQEPVIRLIRKAHVPVIPVRFIDGNSRFYYSLGLIDWRVRLLRLIPEVFNKAGRPFRIVIGPVITPEMQDSISDLSDFSDFLRSKVYSLLMSRKPQDI